MSNIMILDAIRTAATMSTDELHNLAALPLWSGRALTLAARYELRHRAKTAPSMETK